MAAVESCVSQYPSLQHANSTIATDELTARSASDVNYAYMPWGRRQKHKSLDITLTQVRMLSGYVTTHSSGRASSLTSFLTTTSIAISFLASKQK